MRRVIRHGGRNSRHEYQQCRAHRIHGYLQQWVVQLAGAVLRAMWQLEHKEYVPVCRYFGYSEQELPVRRTQTSEDNGAYAHVRCVPRPVFACVCLLKARTDVHWSLKICIQSSSSILPLYLSPIRVQVHPCFLHLTSHVHHPCQPRSTGQPSGWRRAYSIWQNEVTASPRYSHRPPSCRTNGAGTRQHKTRRY